MPAEPKRWLQLLTLQSPGMRSTQSVASRAMTRSVATFIGVALRANPRGCADRALLACAPQASVRVSACRVRSLSREEVSRTALWKGLWPRRVNAGIRSMSGPCVNGE